MLCTWPSTSWLSLRRRKSQTQAKMCIDVMRNADSNRHFLDISCARPGPLIWLVVFKMSCALNTLPTARANKPSPQGLARANFPNVNRVAISIPNRSVKACAADAPVITSKPSSSYVSTSDKYAIIDVGGVQHLVEEGRWYTCNRLKATPGDVVSFGRVLAVKQEDVFHVGRPYVEGVTVEAEVIEDLKGPKVIIYKMQPKKHTRKTVGHRQPLTKYAIHIFCNYGYHNSGCNGISLCRCSLMSYA